MSSNNSVLFIFLYNRMCAGIRQVAIPLLRSSSPTSISAHKLRNQRVLVLSECQKKNREYAPFHSILWVGEQQRAEKKTAYRSQELNRKSMVLSPHQYFCTHTEHTNNNKCAHTPVYQHYTTHTHTRYEYRHKKENPLRKYRLHTICWRIYMWKRNWIFGWRSCGVYVMLCLHSEMMLAFINRVIAKYFSYKCTTHDRMLKSDDFEFQMAVELFPSSFQNHFFFETLDLCVFWFFFPI